VGQIRDTYWLESGQTALVLIDLQERLASAVHPELAASLMPANRMLLAGFRALELPVLATEQYPQGLGPTLPELGEGLQPVSKTCFSAWDSPEFRRILQDSGARQLVLAGIEAHVCVYLTALDLLERGYVVHVARDAVGSRHLNDYQAALENLQQAGAVLTTAEIALFSLVRQAGTPAFKAISALARQR